MLVLFDISASYAQDDVTLDPITVTATRDNVNQSRAPASITVITGEKIENGIPGRVGEVLGTIPGLYMRGSAFDGNNVGNSIGTINLRGIPGAARTLFLLDGIPFNGPLSGTLDYSLLPTQGLDRIEVVPGPFSSLYGSEALGGVINFITKTPTKREISANVSIGGPSPTMGRMAFSYRDALAQGWGIALDGAFADSRGLRDTGATFSSASTTKPVGTITPITGIVGIPTSSGGNTFLIGDLGLKPWWSANGGARIYYDASNVTKFTGGFTYAQSYSGIGQPNSSLVNAAGQPQYNGIVSFVDGGTTKYMNLNGSTNPFLNFVPSGESVFRTFLRGETQFEDTKIKADFSYTYDNAWFVSPSTASTITPTGSGIVLGGPGTYTPGPSNRLLATLQAEKPLNSWNTLTLGTQAQYDWFGRNVQDLSTYTDPSSGTGAISYHTQGWADTLSAFAQNKSDLTNKVSLYLGARYDYWSTAGSTWQQATAVKSTLPTFATSYGERSAGALSPKASLVYLPVEDITLRTSVGQAFRTPDLLQMYSRSQTTLTSVTDAAPNLKPERVTAWETGAEWRIPASSTKIHATYYQNYLTDFIYTQVVSSSLSLRTNAGAARVFGFEAGIDQKLGEDWTIFTNVTHNASRMTSNTAVPVDIGKRLTFTPDWMANAGVTFAKGAFSASLSGRYVSKVYADDQNRDMATGLPGFYDPYVLLDAKASYEIVKGMKLSIIGKNLTNKTYYEYYLQPGRTVWAELSYKY